MRMCEVLRHRRTVTPAGHFAAGLLEYGSISGVAVPHPDEARLRRVLPYAARYGGEILRRLLSRQSPECHDGWNGRGFPRHIEEEFVDGVFEQQGFASGQAR